MDFGLKIRTTIRDIHPDVYFDGKCPFCGSTHIIIRSSYIRKIPDLGSPLEKIIVHLKVCLYFCQECKTAFTPEHPLFPPKLEYSRAVVELALHRFHYNNDSGDRIASDFEHYHQVPIPAATIYSWLKEHSPQFLKAQIEKKSPEDLSHLKTFTVDGSYVHTGTAAIGKKKLVELLSVTKLADGRFLLMWWE
jgi:hypothetical protein